MKILKLFSVLLMCFFALGFTACSNDDEEISNGAYVYAQAVDLGLSVKWATCNVGADSPEDYGDYFAWGEIEPKSVYYTDNCITFGRDFADFSGNPAYDAAAANWGGSWRMPTAVEMKEIVDECTWVWTIQNGVKGCKVTGKNGNSIFLPAAGFRSGSEFSLDHNGYSGEYWSSTPSPNGEGNDCSYIISFDDTGNKFTYYRRGRGYSIRPVTE